MNTTSSVRRGSVCVLVSLFILWGEASMSFDGMTGASNVRSGQYAFGGPENIAFASKYAWVTDPPNDAAVEVDEETGKVVRSVSGVRGKFDTPVSIASDGADVWISGQGPTYADQLSELNATSGLLVRILTAPSGLIAGSGGDVGVCGTHLWYRADHVLVKFSILTGKYQGLIDLSKAGIQSLLGFAIEGNDLWAIGAPDLYEAVDMNCFTGQVKRVVRSGYSSGPISNVAIGGGDLWLSTYSALKEYEANSGTFIRAIKSRVTGEQGGTIAASGTVVCVPNGQGSRVSLISSRTGAIMGIESRSSFLPGIQSLGAWHGEMWLLDTQGYAIIVISELDGKILHYLGPPRG